jgi:hypothetical protein
MSRRDDRAVDTDALLRDRRARQSYDEDQWSQRNSAQP